MTKVDQLQGLIDKEMLSIENLESQLKKLRSQLEYHIDKMKWHKEQLKMIK